MPQAAMLVLAGTETKADLGRVVNALQIARELDESGDEVTVIFDGAGTQWVPALSDEGHKYGEAEGARQALATSSCESRRQVEGLALATRRKD